MIESIRPVLVKEALLLFGLELLDKVKYITADMSYSMKNICEEVLPRARIIIDKFHVIKHLMEALQSVRLQVKRTVQTERKQQKGKRKGGGKKENGYPKKHPAIRRAGQTWSYWKKHVTFYAGCIRIWKRKMLFYWILH